MSGRDGPLVIAGTGGSGTRILLRIARHAGWFMGDDAGLNPQGDVKELGPFANRWIRPYSRAQLRGERPAEWPEIRAELEQRLARHRTPLGNASRPWGWKQPRSIYFMPLYGEMFPGLRFLHVVRDGRDFALVWKKDMVRVEDLFLDAELLELARPLRVVALWARVNELAADYGEHVLGDRYLRVTLEELVGAPEAALARVLPFMGWSREPTEAMRAEVGPAGSIGRWRSLDPKLQKQVGGVARPALVRFGYVIERQPVAAHEKGGPGAPRRADPQDGAEQTERLLAETERKLEVVTHARARAEELHGSRLAELAAAAARARGGLERAQASRSWRWGHGLARLSRKVTLRRPGRTNALEEAAAAVERMSDTLERDQR